MQTMAFNQIHCIVIYGLFITKPIMVKNNNGDSVLFFMFLPIGDDEG